MADRKRILLVSNGFFPEISPRSYRATELAKEFCRQGHEVTVISRYRDFDYSAFLEKMPIKFLMWRKQRYPRIPDWKRQPFAFISRVLTRLLLMLFEYPGIEEMFSVRKILRDHDGYDLMISFAVPYPVQWGVAWARRADHRIAEKWIADCGDPYMGDVLDSFRKPFYFGYLEKNFSRKADYITIPVESAMAGYYKEFHKKIRVIPQGFNFVLREEEELTDNEIPTFAYAGSFLVGARDPRPMLEYLSSLSRPFKFLVYTNMPEFLEGFREKLGEKLVVSDYIPRDELMKILSGVDFLINFDNNTTLNLPSKLIDYAIIGRPVLNIRRSFSGGEMAEFLDRNYSNRMKLPDPAEFHITRIAGKFLGLLEQ